MHDSVLVGARTNYRAGKNTANSLSALDFRVAIRKVSLVLVSYFSQELRLNMREFCVCQCRKPTLIYIIIQASKFQLSPSCCTDYVCLTYFLSHWSPTCSCLRDYRQGNILLYTKECNQPKVCTPNSSYYSNVSCAARPDISAFDPPYFVYVIKRYKTLISI
jgi:hypothetical protein